MAKNLQEIGELIENTKFRPKLCGGVDEYDVWIKIGRLHKEYTELFGISQQRSDAVVQEWREYVAALQADIREKEEQILRLTNRKRIYTAEQTGDIQTCQPKQPWQATAMNRRAPKERMLSPQRVIRVQKACATNRKAYEPPLGTGLIEQKRILSAEEIRRIYDRENPAGNCLYG